MHRIVRASLVLVAALSVPRVTEGAQILLNPGFETGTFAGWTALTGVGEELTPWTVDGAGGGWFENTAPLSGSFDAYNGFDGDAGLTYALFQDVLIPSGDTATLTTNHRIQFDSLGIPSTQPRLFEITVRDTSDNVLETLFSFNAVINGAPYTDTGWVNQTFDLSAYAGSLVRIHFFESIPESFTGPANLELDDITLEVPVPEPATFLMLALGFTGVRVSRRFRRPRT